LASLLVAFALQSAARGQSPVPNAQASLTTDQVVNELVRRNQDRAAALKHYESCRYYNVDYVGFPKNKTAAMVVEMAFDAPAQKQFHIVKQEGSQILLDHVIRELIQNEKEALDAPNLGRTDLTPQNYTFELVGTDNLGGQPQYVLDVAPRFKSKFLYHGKIWVDANDFAVTQLSAQPAKNPSFWISHTEIHHEYKKIGEFWLPARNSSVTHVRFGGTAKLNIDYRDYRIGNSASGTPQFCAADPTADAKVQVSEKH
jgi:hypothetical protein